MTTKNKLLIIGASGHGKVVADVAVKMEKWEHIYFLDDDETIKESLGLKIIGKSSDAKKFIKDYDLFVGIGNNQVREKIQNNLLADGATIPTLIHPSAVINTQVNIDTGTVIMAGSIINSSSTIGEGCILNTGSTIDHDNHLENFVHISPGTHLAGNVTIGRRTWMGIGSVVSNNISVTNDCIIGAGAVVVKNISITGTYIGLPVRRL